MDLPKLADVAIETKTLRMSKQDDLFPKSDCSSHDLNLILAKLGPLVKKYMVIPC